MTTTTQTLPPAKSPSSRPCPNCVGTLTKPPCANCGWEPGLVPVAVTQTADGPVTTFAAESGTSSCWPSAYSRASWVS